MANPKPVRSKATEFKPGKSGNPNGSSRLKRNQTKIDGLSVRELEAVGGLFSAGVSWSEILAIAQDKNADALKHWVCRLAVVSALEGDVGTFDRLMTRFVGRPKETVEITGRDGGPMQVQTMEQMQATLAAIRANNAEMGDD